MGLLVNIIDFILYSNLWIAFCAAAMALQTQLLLSGRTQLSPLIFFIFFGSMFLYAMHRLFSLAQAPALQESGRFLVIGRLRKKILVLLILAAILAGWFLLKLPGRVITPMIIPCGLAAAYVLPVLGRGRRLRDLPYIKIFLIALTWAWITVALPAIELGLGKNIPMYLMLLERALFIFAITLPFDLRDLSLDRGQAVRTLPGKLGARKTRLLSGVALAVMGLIASLNWRIDAYATGAFLGLCGSIVTTFYLVWRSDSKRHDYYFTGLLDGTMPLQLGWVSLGLFIFG